MKSRRVFYALLAVLSLVSVAGIMEARRGRGGGWGRRGISRRGWGGRGGWRRRGGFGPGFGFGIGIGSPYYYGYGYPYSGYWARPGFYIGF